MKIKNLKFEIIGASIFILFVIFSIIVNLNLFSAFDYHTTIAFQKFIPDYLTTSFSAFSILGTVEIASLFLLVLLFLFSKLRKLYVLFFYGLTGIIEIAGKSIITQKGPPIEFLKTNIHLGLPTGGISDHFFSFPSGHVTRTVFISAVLLFAIWKSSIKKELKYTLVVLILIFDFLMLLSRVYLGEHWLSDVIGGTLLGFSLALLTVFLLNIKKS